MMIRAAAALSIAAATMGAGPANAEQFIHDVPPASRFVQTSDITYDQDRTLKKPLQFDIYRPNQNPAGEPAPVVIFVNGIGAAWIRKSPGYSAWGKLVTTSGLAGVLFDTEDGAAAKNFEALLSNLRMHAREWNIDPSRVAVYAASSNVKVGLSLAENPRLAEIRAAAIYYGFADVPDFRPEVPLLFVRAGLDRPVLNRSLDRIVSSAIAANVPVSVIALGSAHHAFETTDDDDAARGAIDATLAFFKQSLQKKMIALRAAQSAESLAASALYLQDWRSAVTRYRELTSSQPQRASLFESLGQALEGAGDDRGAATAYRTALDLGTVNRGLVAVTLARISLRLNDRADALRWLQMIKGDSFTGFRRAIKDDPAFTPLHDDPIFREIFGA